MDLNMKQLEEQMQTLTAQLAGIHKAITEKGDSSIRQEVLDKVAADAAAAVEKRMFALPDGMKFGSAAGDLGLAQFLRMVKNDDQRLRGMKTTEQSTTDADGGYSVPDAFYGKIVELMQNAAILAPLCTEIGQDVETMNIPKGLTNPTISWVAEKSNGSLTKATFGNMQSVLKKLIAIIPFTSELLDFNQANVDAVIERAVALGMAREIDRVIAAGNTGAGDPFMGILYATGVNAVASQAGGTSYDDVVDALNAVTVEAFHAKAGWMLNRAGLKVLMKIKDLQDKPIFMSGANGIPSTILDKPFKITDVIPSAATTSILYGDLSNVWLTKHNKKAGIIVDQSNSAVSGTTDIDQNAWMSDQIWYRWKLRKGVLVAVASAFSKLTGVK